MAGLDLTGFTPKTALEIKAEIEAAWRAEFGANVLLSPNEPDGQLIGILTERFAELWELLQAIYAAYDPDKALGQALDAVCAITGTVRDPATRSEVTLTATGDDGTSLLTGREASVAITGDRFRTTEDATLVLLDVWAALTFYDEGDRVSNDGNAYQATASGTSAGAGGPSGEGTAILDGSVTWRFLGAGEAAVDIPAEGVETGPLLAVSGTLTTIETPVSGWSGVTNVEDADPGSDEESDDALRAKREAELAAAGAGTINAIRADLLKVDDVTAAVVFQNDTDAVDADGRPPHSVEAVVEGGTDDEIAASLFKNVSAGIATFGSETVQVADSYGNLWDVNFNRVDLIAIWVRVDVVVNALEFPVNGADQIKAAIVADEANYDIGLDVRASRVEKNVWSVPGVLDVSLTYIGISNPAVAATTIVLDVRERASFDTGRITVNVSAGSP